MTEEIHKDSHKYSDWKPQNTKQSHPLNCNILWLRMATPQQ